MSFPIKITMTATLFLYSALMTYCAEPCPEYPKSTSANCECERDDWSKGSYSVGSATYYYCREPGERAEQGRAAFADLEDLLSAPTPAPIPLGPTIEEQVEAARENRQNQPPPCRRLSFRRRQVHGASGAGGWSGASGTQVDCYEDGSHGGYSRNPGQPASPDEAEGSIPDWIGGLAVLVCLACCIFGIFKFIKGMCCSSEQKESGAEGARGSPPSQQV